MTIVPFGRNLPSIQSSEVYFITGQFNSSSDLTNTHRHKINGQKKDPSANRLDRIKLTGLTYLDLGNAEIQEEQLAAIA